MCFTIPNIERQQKISALYKKCPLKWVLDYIEQKKPYTPQN